MRKFLGLLLMYPLFGYVMAFVLLHVLLKKKIRQLSILLVNLMSMFIKLRHLRGSRADLFCAFRLTPNDQSVWIVERLDHRTKLYKCYNMLDKQITMYVNQETNVYEYQFE